MANFSRDHRPRLADDGGAADLRELAAIAGRDLGENNVADVEHALAGGADGEIVLRRAHQQEIVLGAEFFHEAIELGGKLEFAHAGPRVFEEPLVAALGDPGRALRRLQFLGRAQAGEIARQFIGGFRQRTERRGDAIEQRRCRARTGQRRPCATDRGDGILTTLVERGGEIVGADGAVGRRGRGSARLVPGRRHDQGRSAVAIEHDGAFADRAHARENIDGVGIQKIIEAVARGDQAVERSVGEMPRCRRSTGPDFSRSSARPFLSSRHGPRLIL